MSTLIRYSERRGSTPVGFRPEAVPVLRTDESLPIIPSERQSVAALRAQFAQSPVWEPESRQERVLNANSLIKAAVLVPITARKAPGILLTQRSSALSSHAGQIAFPGGRVDAGDESNVAAALREAREEVGLRPEYVEVLGELPAYLTGSGYQVHPVVALVDSDAPLLANPAEVTEIFEIPIAHFFNPANHRHHEYSHDGMMRQWLSMPYQDEKMHERYVWGVTASILRNFYRFMLAK